MYPGRSADLGNAINVSKTKIIIYRATGDLFSSVYIRLHDVPRIPKQPLAVNIIITFPVTVSYLPHYMYYPHAYYTTNINNTIPTVKLSENRNGRIL